MVNPSGFRLARILTQLAALCLLLAAASAGAFASPVTYTYTGNPLNLVSTGSSCPGSCSIDATITLAAPLGDNLNLASVTPLSFSMTDGSLGDSLNQANAPDYLDTFWFSTDASGDIIGWLVQAITSGGNAVIATDNYFGGTSDEAGNATYVLYNVDNPGTWSQTSTSPTPEPSSLLLLGTGLLGLGPFIRRFMR